MELPAPSIPGDSAEPSDAAFTSVTPYYDELMAGVPYRFWVSYLEQVWQHHALAPKRILDVACGTGTATRMLAQRGHAMTGVDLSGGMLVRARERSRAEGLDIPYYRQDAAEMDLGAERFDGAISLFDSLNYILDEDRLRSALARVARHLAPGGSFLFDMNTEYALAEGLFNQSCTRRNEPLHFRWRSSYDIPSRICTVRMRFSYDPGDGNRLVFKEVHRQKGYHKEEILTWMGDAGFEQVFIYDAYTLEPPKKRSDRLFYLGIMPGE